MRGENIIHPLVSFVFGFLYSEGYGMRPVRILWCACLALLIVGCGGSVGSNPRALADRFIAKLKSGDLVDLTGFLVDNVLDKEGNPISRKEKKIAMKQAREAAERLDKMPEMKRYYEQIKQVEFTYKRTEKKGKNAMVIHYEMRMPGVEQSVPFTVPLMKKNGRWWLTEAALKSTSPTRR